MWTLLKTKLYLKTLITSGTTKYRRAYTGTEYFYTYSLYKIEQLV